MRKVIATLIVGVLFGAGCASHPQAKHPEPATFDATVAMRSLFANFDPIIKASLYRVPEDAVQDPNFANKDEIRSRLFFVQDTTENGIHKYYVLAWAKPAGQPFDCQGCAPLISAAVFVPGSGGWQLESVGRAAIIFGDFGKPPEAQLVNIGSQHHAFLLRYTTNVAQTTTYDALLVPWKANVHDAMQWISGESNQGDCGGAYPCFGYQRDLKFVPGINSDYYDIVLKLAGTNMSQRAPFNLHKVSGTERLRFQDGKYMESGKSPQTIIAERRTH
ncbi:MAG: hypothetical protein ACM3JB_05355 [Acidobacteriaceae bacterium]